MPRSCREPNDGPDAVPYNCREAVTSAIDGLSNLQYVRRIGKYAGPRHGPLFEDVNNIFNYWRKCRFQSLAGSPLQGPAAQTSSPI